MWVSGLDFVSFKQLRTEMLTEALILNEFREHVETTFIYDSVVLRLVVWWTSEEIAFTYMAFLVLLDDRS